MDYIERPNLWGWAGSTNGKAERTDMLNALERDNSSEQVLKLGWLQTFSGFAGMPAGAAGSFNEWQYSMMMQEAVLYHLDNLKFAYIILRSWKDLPDKLLHLARDVSEHPQVCLLLFHQRLLPSVSFIVRYSILCLETLKTLSKIPEGQVMFPIMKNKRACVHTSAGLDIAEERRLTETCWVIFC